MEWLLTGILLTTFFVLGASRLIACIRAAAIQGMLLSALPLLLPGTLTASHSLVLFIGTFLIKGVLIPFFLFRSIRETTVREEMEPSVSRHLSLLVGGFLVVLAFSWDLPSVPPFPYLSFVVQMALTIVLLGFLLLVTRRKAVTQVIGFLVLENGIFLFGMTLVSEFPLTVEMGVLLDLLVGVFVMGIMIYHINRTFDHIDTMAWSSLKDS